MENNTTKERTERARTRTLPQRRSACGTRRGTRILEGCVVRKSPRGRGRRIEVVPNDLGFSTNSVVGDGAVCVVSTAVHARAFFAQCAVSQCARSSGIRSALDWRPHQ
eukprot:IDg20966t1